MQKQIHVIFFLSLLHLSLINSMSLFQELSRVPKNPISTVNTYDDFDSSEYLSDCLFKAIEQNNLLLVQNCIVSGVAVNKQKKSGETPLYRASCIGALPICQALLEAGASCDVESKYCIPIFGAIDNNKKKVIQLLLEYAPFSIYLTNCDGATPLIKAIDRRDTSSDIPRLLVSKWTDFASIGYVEDYYIKKMVQQGYTTFNSLDKNTQKRLCPELAYLYELVE